MTPSALTPAARVSTKKPRSDRPGHRSELRRPVAPRSPRRVSGPSRSTGGVETLSPPRQPGPRRTATRPRASAAVRPATRASWPIRSVAYVRAVPDHVLLDRVVRGRAWIPLLGVLLAGIVAMQVETLKLNAGIGRSLDRGSTLQSQNESLLASVARLADDQRIERLAAGMGLAMPAPQMVKFLHSGAATNQRALSTIHAPDATTFTAALTAEEQAALAQDAATSPPTTTGTSGVSVGAAATGGTTAVVSPATGTITPSVSGGAADGTPSTSDATSGTSAASSSSGTPATTPAPATSSAPVSSSSPATSPVSANPPSQTSAASTPAQSPAAGPPTGSSGAQASSGGVGPTPVGG
jgi:hypothetical protein